MPSIGIGFGITSPYIITLSTGPVITTPNFQTIDYASSQTFSGRTYTVTSAENPYNIQRATNYDLTRFEVRTGDLRVGDPADRERAELSGSPFAFTGSGEIWMAYSMLPINLDNSWWTTLFQGFGLANGDNTYEGPTLKLEHKGNGTKTGINIAGNNTNSARVQIDLWDGTIFEENKIYNIVWRCSFHGTEGKLTLWSNGVQLFSEQNLPMGFGTNPLTYLKYGIYRDVQTGDQPPVIVIFSDPEYAQGLNALQARITNPTPMPHYSTQLPLGALTGAVVYAPPVPLSTEISPTAWTETESTGSTATNNPTGTFTLIGGGTGVGAAIDQQILTTANVKQNINFTVAQSAVNLRIGTTEGDAQIFPLTSYSAGTHLVEITPTGTSMWIRFNKQAIATSVVSNISLTDVVVVAPVVELNADPSFNSPTSWALYGSGIGSTAVVGGAMDVLSTTSSWAFRIKNGDVAFAAGTYRITIIVADWVSGAFSPSGHDTNLNIIGTGNSQLGTVAATGNGTYSWDITLTVPMHLGIRGRSGVTDMRVTDLSLSTI